MTKVSWLAVAAITCTCAAALVGASLKAPPAAPIIAIVDLEDVVKGLNERTDKEAALTSQKASLEAKIKQIKDEADADKTRMDQEPAGAGQLALAKGVREKLFRAEFERQYAQRLLDETQTDMLRDLYTKIAAAAQEMAKQNGYSMVLASDERVNIPRGDPEAVTRAITLKRMLYVDKSMDITADLVQLMNNQYAAGGSKPSTAAPPQTTPITPPPAKTGKK